MNKRLALWGRLGLRGRLLMLLTPILILTGAVLHTIQLQREAVEFRVDMSHEMNNAMDLLEMSLAEHARSGDVVSIERILRVWVKSPLLAEIYWKDRSGMVVEALAQPPKQVAPAWFRWYFGIHDLEQSRTLAAGGVSHGLIRVKFSGATLENHLWSETRNQLWRFGMELGLLVLILSIFLARWLRPLEIINAAGRRFMGGDFSVRVADSPRFVPEIRAMGEMLNQAVTQVGGLVLSLSEQRRAIDSAVIVVESDLNGIVFYVNDKFCEVSGYRRDEVIGKDHRFLKSGYHTREFFEDLWRTVKRGDTWQGEICNYTKGGGILWLITTITPILGKDGKPFKYISVWVDITRRKLAENVLSQQAQIIDQTQDAVFSTDLKGTLVSWNSGAELLFGYSAHEAIGEPVRFIAPLGGEADFHATVFLALTRDGGGVLETLLRKKSGEIFTAHFSLTLLRDEEGLEIGVAGYVLDITERKRIENTLREREASLAFAQRVAHLGSWEWVLESGSFQWSDEMYRIWGFMPRAYPSYEIFLDSIYPDDRELVEKFVTAALQNEVLFSIDHRIALQDGGVRFVHEEAQVFRNEAGKAVNVVGTAQDITERKQIEQEIRESREQLRELSNHLQTVREEEKATIARECHDELGGNLTALKMDIYWLARKLPPEPELDAAREKVESMSSLVDASVHAMRRVVTELRPTVLDDLGLLAAMQWQASEFTKRYNIQCKVWMHGEEIAMKEECRIALFRIFQEALTNVARYSKASQVLVDVWREHDKIALEVFDNGIGIPEGAIMQPTSHGLRGMVERARSLGGSVEIGSAPGEGVAISVRIPLPVALETEA